MSTTTGSSLAVRKSLSHSKQQVHQKGTTHATNVLNSKKVTEKAADQKMVEL